MRYGSVCSGIEAATVAWHPLGWEPAWFAEIEDFPSRVLAHHYPNVRNYGDFTQIPDSAGPIDLLVGGTPCQSFSVAGLRGGLTDERGNLALEYCRLAACLRPRWIVWENVPGVLSSNGGRDFGSIIGALAQLGYGLAYRVLDAQFFGVPQRRRRVFLVGYLGDWRRAAAVLFEPESLRGNPAALGKTRKDAAPGARGRAAGGGVAGTVTAHRGNIRAEQAWGGSLIPYTAKAVRASTGRRGTDDPDRMTFIPQCVTGTTTHTLRADGFDASEDGTGRGHDRRSAPGAVAFHITQDPISGPVSPALSAGNGSGCASVGVLYGRGRDGATLTAHESRLDFETESFVLQSAVRRLTPRECERLQGFPDDYTAIPGGAVRIRRERLEADWIKYMRRGGILTLEQVLQLVADGPRYRALGNSMAVPVMRWIGERIQRVERLMRR